VSSVSSTHRKSTTARRRGRHRAPARVHWTIKTIGVAGPLVAMLGAFVAYQAQPQQAGSVAGSAAAYRMAQAADGSHTGTSGDKAKPRPSGRAGSAHRGGENGKTAGTSHQAQRHDSPSATTSPSPAGSSANLTAAVQKDIADGNYLLAVAQYLVKNGYSDTAAAGVASCVDGESGGNPESVGSGGGGLIGWTPISAAAPNPDIITGNAAQDMMTQLGDLLYYNSTEIGQSLVAQLNGISDPVAAADFYSQNFEKPAVTDSDVVPSVAEQILSELHG
jgi:hypothetical protein